MPACRTLSDIRGLQAGGNGSARSLLSLRWLEEHLLHFPAVSLNDKPYFLKEKHPPPAFILYKIAAMNETNKTKETVETLLHRP